MASFALTVSARLPQGTEVSAYPVSNWTNGSPNLRLPPPGPASDTQVMGAARLTFTGLEAARYVAHAEINGEQRYVSFTAGQDEAVSSLVTAAQRRALVGTAGTPDSDNPYVTAEDPLLGTIPAALEQMTEDAVAAALSPEWILLEPFMADTVGWQVGESGSLVPAFRRVGDTVELRGVVHHVDGSNPFATLPEGYRPTFADGQREIAPIMDPEDFETIGRMLVAPGGAMQARKLPADPMGVALDGISFSIAELPEE